MAVIIISHGLFIKHHKEGNIWTVHDHDAWLENGSHFNRQLGDCTKF